MPRKTVKSRKVAGPSPLPRSNRRKATPKQARELSRHGRTSPQSVRPMKFPGRQGGR